MSEQEANGGNTRTAPGSTQKGFRQVLAVARDVSLPVAAISVVFVMLIPLPAEMLDVLIACSIAAAVLVFLTAVQVSQGG